MEGNLAYGMLRGLGACASALSTLLTGTAYARTLPAIYDARYGWDDNALVLNFTEGISRFMVDVSEITIAVNRAPSP